jgi:hypothetical protein
MQEGGHTGRFFLSGDAERRSSIEKKFRSLETLFA